MVFTTLMPYVQFECAKCGSEGGLAVCEEDALVMWNRQYEP